MSRIMQKDAPRQAFEASAPPAGPVLPEGRLRRLNVSANAMTALTAMWGDTDPPTQWQVVAALGRMDDDEFVAWAGAYDVPDGTIDEVTAWVDAHPDLQSAAEAALVVEAAAEKPRVTLVAALETRIKTTTDG